MLPVERHVAIHAEYRHRELLKAAQDARQVRAARASQTTESSSKPTPQRAGWAWPLVRARRPAAV